MCCVSVDVCVVFLLVLVCNVWCVVSVVCVRGVCCVCSVWCVCALSVCNAALHALAFRGALPVLSNRHFIEHVHFVVILHLKLSGFLDLLRVQRLSSVMIPCLIEQLII